MLTYQERFIPGQRDSLILLQNLLESGLFFDYMMYHQQQEVRIAANALATVSVSLEAISINGLDQQQFQPIRDPFKQVESAFSKLAIENWTAYGYVSFDMARFYYPYTKAIDQPLLYFFVPETELRITAEGVYIKSLKHLSKLQSLCEIETSAFHNYSSTSLPELYLTEKQQYIEKVQQLIEAIQAGELQKAIICRSIKFPGELDILGTYALGYQGNHSARSYCFQFGEVQGVGFSPEILMEIHANNWTVTNPLAGTRPRGENIEEDLRLQRELFSDAKEVKEHALSILLVQQEMAEICVQNTVKILDFMQVKQYPYVQHLSSHVVGQLQADKTPWDALKALFPAITVSGIEKSQAIAWIDRLEDTPRGIYAGAIGWFNCEGKADFAIPIRSAYQYGNSIHLNAGAGIMGESIPQKEYIECGNKMNTILTNLVLKTD
ncbi:MAG: chorismate-binding protein [Limnoraphis robusta]|uniref:Anthranilate synthase n=1 Tax=Limnoraphis robusta CS-951 TaxID=1637645 RepID=A0A0F5Y9Y4_9CYAN|nr:chorismate-binding protein [Limnoraphis robusta]KKD35669.1 anthranilate synthase [Limnoraphis robusta CS-951]